MKVTRQTRSVLEDVMNERISQAEKWDNDNTIVKGSLADALAVLTEEVGEVAQIVADDCMSRRTKRTPRADKDQLYGELIQVAAVAAAFAERVG